MARSFHPHGAATLAKARGGFGSFELLWALLVEPAEAEARSTSHASQDATASSPCGEGAAADPCVRLLHDGEAKRRLRIFLRPTGSFYFREEYFSERPLEECWIPVAGGGVGFYDSEQTALREATAELDWLRHWLRSTS